jgi:hypothetical protein
VKVFVKNISCRGVASPMIVSRVTTERVPLAFSVMIGRLPQIAVVETPCVMRGRPKAAPKPTFAGLNGRDGQLLGDVADALERGAAHPGDALALHRHERERRLVRLVAQAAAVEDLLRDARRRRDRAVEEHVVDARVDVRVLEAHAAVEALEVEARHHVRLALRPHLLVAEGRVGAEAVHAVDERRRAEGDEALAVERAVAGLAPVGAELELVHAGTKLAKRYDACTLGRRSTSACRRCCSSGRRGRPAETKRRSPNASALVCANSAWSRCCSRFWKLSCWPWLMFGTPGSSPCARTRETFRPCSSSLTPATVLNDAGKSCGAQFQ